MKTKNLTLAEAMQSGKPFKRKHWAKWCVLKDGVLCDEEGGEVFTCYYANIAATDWELKTEKKTKRYWLWDIRLQDNKIFKTSEYLDENGLNTIGQKYMFAFNEQSLLRKHEDEFIDIEVDE